MAIILNPGFSGIVSIKNDQVELYRKNVQSPAEAQNFINTYGKSVRGYTLWRASLIPLRLDNWKDFAKDLFLPTFINFALKVNNIALKIFASPFAIAFDVLTLIPRLLLTPLRFHYNGKNKQEHPLVALIKDKPDAAESLKSGIVNLHVKMEQIDIKNDRLNGLDAAEQKTIEGNIRVAIKALHGIDESSDYKTSNVKYLKVNGEWDAQESIKGTSKKMQFSC